MLYELTGVFYLPMACENGWIIPPCLLLTPRDEQNINWLITALYTFIFVLKYIDITPLIYIYPPYP
jgi:hypothetical protein